MIVLISDLLTDRDGLFRGLKLLRHRGHDVLVFHVLDDEELDFNYSGTTRFEGFEDAGDLTCDPRALRDGYLRGDADRISTTCDVNVRGTKLTTRSFAPASISMRRWPCS